MSRIGFLSHGEHPQVRGVGVRVALASPAMRFLQYLWAGPASCVGLLLAALGVVAGGRISWHSGVLEAEGRLLAWGLRHLTLLEGGASAITFGHVVLGTSRAALDSTRAHERVHVRQYERWGPLFIPLYMATSLWAAVSGRHAYYDNPFERDAYTHEAHPDIQPEPAYRYDRAVDRKFVLEFAGRDWARVAEAKASFWLNRKRGSSPAELLAMGDQLLRHAQSVRPDWPAEAERAADLAVHLRVAEALRAAGSRLR